MRVELINAPKAICWLPGADAPGVFKHEGWPEAPNTPEGSFCVDLPREGNRVEVLRLNPMDWIVYDEQGRVRSVWRQLT